MKQTTQNNVTKIILFQSNVTQWYHIDPIKTLLMVSKTHNIPNKCF